MTIRDGYPRCAKRHNGAWSYADLRNHGHWLISKLLSCDLHPRRAVDWVYRIGAPSQPFDRHYVLTPLLASLLASLFLLLSSRLSSHFSSRFSLLLALRFLSFLLLHASRFSLLASSRSSLPLVSPSSRFLLLTSCFFSLLASSRFSFLSLLASRFFCVLQSRPGNGGVVGFPLWGFAYESDWPSLGGSYFRFSFRFSTVRDQEFSARTGG